MKLSKHSYAVETLIKQQTSLTPSFLNSHANAIQQLENAFYRVFKGLDTWMQQRSQQQPNIPVDAKQLNLSRLKTDINQLQQQTALGEVSAQQSLDKIAEQLAGHQHYQSLLRQLRDDLDNYDFDEALAVIQQLQAHLFSIASS